MADLIETVQWEATIYQLETTDPVKGGNDGISNRQAKQLANRTAYLKQQVELKAPLASPIFTGTPKVPTADADTSTTQAASTEFVIGQAANTVPVMNGIAAVGISKKFARQDHVHPIDTSRAPVASPTFTGKPAVPTAAVDNNTTQVASTAFVQAQIAAGHLASKSSNGYQKLPSGLIIQWGYAGTSTAGISTTFPITFPNACLAVVAVSNNNTSNVSIATNITSASTFTLYSASVTPAAYFIAIGW